LNQTPPTQIRIILVDDHDLVRESWKLLLDKDDRFCVIAQFNNGAEAIKQAGNLLPDIILMDINMSPINGFEATQKITEIIPSARIIGISVNTNQRYVTKMLTSGAKGFVTKTSPLDELKMAIVKVHNGENYICEEIKKNHPGKGE
jgi:DNA-binding NarL/FixJ family response regulator